MKLILNDHIEHLGERGQSVAVKAGYANNYLLPKGLAYPDTPGNRKRFEQEQTKWEEMDLSRQSAAQQLASELDGTKLAFERRAGENDVLFGSVTAAEIGRELAERGFEIDRRRIMLEHPIKALGLSTSWSISTAISMSRSRCAWCVPARTPTRSRLSSWRRACSKRRRTPTEAEAASIAVEGESTPTDAADTDAPEAEPVPE